MESVILRIPVRGYQVRNGDKKRRYVDAHTGTASQGVHRLVLADDNASVLEATGQLLDSEFQIAGTAADGLALIDSVSQLRPDAVVSDLNMPVLNGIDAAEKLIRSGLCDKIVILSVYNDPYMIRRALQAGIRGYVLKVDAGDELATALHTVIAGGWYISHGALAKAAEVNRFRD